MEQGRSKTAVAHAITERFAEEISKQGLSIAEIARRIDVKVYRLHDVLSFKQRLPTDLLARAARLGIDVNYVLTGVKPALSSREAALIQNYRSASSQQKDHLEAAFNAFAEPHRSCLVKPESKTVKECRYGHGQM